MAQEGESKILERIERRHNAPWNAKWVSPVTRLARQAQTCSGQDGVADGVTNGATDGGVVGREWDHGVDEAGAFGGAHSGVSAALGIRDHRRLSAAAHNGVSVTAPNGVSVAPHPEICGGSIARDEALDLVGDEVDSVGAPEDLSARAWAIEEFAWLHSTVEARVKEAPEDETVCGPWEG